MSITARTQLAGVIGDPVRHSRSPAMFNAAFAATDCDWVYVALPVPAGRGSDAVRAMGLFGIRGLNVTMPHKRDAALACAGLSANASVSGVVNTCVLHDDGSVFGDSTDGAGLLRALAEVGVTPRGASVCVIGAGGAARSVVYALGEAGATVSVAARNLEAAAQAAALAPKGRSVGLDDVDDILSAVDLVVHATPVGMRGEAPIVDVARLSADAFVYDLVYAPEPTPLVAAALEAGLGASDGLGMLVHQAALAFEQFTGREAPLDVMRQAATIVG